MPPPQAVSQIKHNQQNGYSLIELIVVLSIVSILVSIGVSSYTAWLTRTQSEELIEDMKRTLTFVRSAAIKHGGNIRLCGSNDGATCTGSLDKGWIVFNDADGSNARTNNETLIRIFERSSNRFAVSLNDAAGPTSISGITFNYKGYANVSLVGEMSLGNISQSFTMTRSGYFP